MSLLLSACMKCSAPADHPRIAPVHATHLLCRLQWPPPQRDAPPGPAPTSLSRYSAASQAGLHTSAHRVGRAAAGARCPTSSSIFPLALEQQRSASVSPTGHPQVTQPGTVQHKLL